MVDEALLKELKAKRDGEVERSTEDIFQVFEVLSQVAAEEEEVKEEMEDVELCIQFTSKDSDLKFWCAIKEDKLTYGKGEGSDVTATFIATDETLAGLMSGEIDGTSAYMAGDLVIEGNLQDSMTFGEITSIASDLIQEMLDEI